MKVYKRMSIILFTGIMMIGLSTFQISSGGFHVSGSMDTPNKVQVASAAPVAVITATPTPTPEPNILLEEAYPEIHDLIKSYYDAKLEVDKEAFRNLVTDISYINMDEIQAKTSAVTAFTDITCYTKKGVGEIDLVCYVRYYMDIVTIDTPVLSLDELLIQYDEMGDPLIFMGEIQNSTHDELVKLRSDADVAALISSTQKEINEALKSDEDLLAFWQRNMSGEPAQAPEPTPHMGPRDLPPEELAALEAQEALENAEAPVPDDPAEIPG
ncbi:MAG: hypothetical protein IKR54_08420 [Lachnospiraceae bacterium]|nr:hypothetical protein [Lachnospiraceae bacterium]